jgi:hypothetical protein
VLQIVLLISTVSAQTAREVAVEIKASWVSGIGIKLDWRYDASTTSYDVYKRIGNSWVKKKNTSGLTWTDSLAVEGVRYEYRVARNSSAYSFTGNGYISAGFRIPATENLGKVLIVLDSNYSIPLASTISQYKQQLTHEGWTVIQKSFLRTAAVSDIKSWIKSQWDGDSNNIKAAILLGKIPVPYSGNFRPDGYSEHTGAWPADMYYGTFWSSWTDVSVKGLSTTANGFSFIGNPYQSPVDMSGILASSSNFNSTYYYVWDPNIGTRGSYVAVNVLTNSNSLGSNANKLLQPGQACFVQTVNSGSASLTFTESAKSSGITNVWKSELPFDWVTIKLFRSEVGQAPGILQDAATMYLDSLELREKHSWNAGKLINQDENLGLKYAGNKYAVFVLGYGLDTIPLHISQLRSSENVLRFESSNVKLGYALTLIDTYKDTSMLLDSGQMSYTWVARDGELDSQRFYIVIDRKQNLGIRGKTEQFGKDSDTNLLLFPNPMERGAWIQINTSLMSVNQVRWWGMNGKLILEESLGRDSMSFRVKNNLPVGLYWVQLIGPDANTWQKVLVK